MSRFTFLRYFNERVSGIELQPVERRAASMSRDRTEFAAFCAQAAPHYWLLSLRRAAGRPPVASSGGRSSLAGASLARSWIMLPIGYAGDIDQDLAALEQMGDGFLDFRHRINLGDGNAQRPGGDEGRGFDLRWGIFET
jgi:hypothetical protein